MPNSANVEPVDLPVSLRDWFAGMALPQVIGQYPIGNMERMDYIARHAYSIADAMLMAREVDR